MGRRRSRITKAEGNVLYELDGKPALQLYKTYLGDLANRLPGSGLLFPLSVAIVPLFVMLKPSVIYVVVGVVMLKRGWMNRYLPPIAQATVPDLGIRFGYIWAGLMFFSAVLNVVLALVLDPASWAAVKSAWAIGSKIVLFLIQYAVMKSTGIRRAKAAMAAAA